MIAYRDARPEDAAAICTVARTSYVDTFGTLYSDADLNAFLDAAFGPTGLAAHVTDPAYRVHVATEGDGEGGPIVGFAKLGPVAFPGEWSDDTIELHQLYVLKAHHGAGVGPALTDWALATARAMGKRHVVLSVYVDNERAKAFYRRLGFVDIGRYDFVVGETVDEDRLMRLTL